MMSFIAVQRLITAALSRTSCLSYTGVHTFQPLRLRWFFLPPLLLATLFLSLFLPCVSFQCLFSSPFGLVIALRPQTPKHIRGGWSHYTDTSEQVDGGVLWTTRTILSVKMDRENSLTLLWPEWGSNPIPSDPQSDSNRLRHRPGLFFSFQGQ
jgi:hypothetical protein